MIRLSFLRTAFIRSCGGPQRHVHQNKCFQLYRSYHSSPPSCFLPSVEAKQSSGSSHVQGRLEELRRQFMVTTNSPAITKQEDILEQVKELFDHQGLSADIPPFKDIVMLATPSFTAWLEDTTFMSRILNTLFPISQPKDEVHAILAVVDGLPCGTATKDSQVLSTEGFAFLLCRRPIDTPEILQNNEPNHSGGQSIDEKSSITFLTPWLSAPQNNELRTPAKEDETRKMKVTLPLANTMFRNGRTSTLLATRWNRAESSTQFERTKQVEKRSQDICSFATSLEYDVADIPLTHLTPNRVVVSGLGNIVKQICGADEKPVPASQELEVAVEAYFKNTLTEKRAIAVWALISRAPGRDLNGQPYTSETIEAGPEAQRVQELLQSLRFDSLRRVLSGGGGWGPKQGLLALDPEDNLSNDDNDNGSPDFDMSESMGDRSYQALGHIVESGSLIQFLTSKAVIDDSSKGDNGLQVAKFPLVLGCIPSTIDDIPQQVSESVAESGTPANRPKIQTLDGQFGAQSEKGIYISFPDSSPRTGSSQPTKRTKIDVPYAHLKWRPKHD